MSSIEALLMKLQAENQQIQAENQQIQVQIEQRLGSLEVSVEQLRQRMSTLTRGLVVIRDTFQSVGNKISKWGDGADDLLVGMTTFSSS